MPSARWPTLLVELVLALTWLIYPLNPEWRGALMAEWKMPSRTNMGPEKELQRSGELMSGKGRAHKTDITCMTAVAPAGMRVTPYKQHSSQWHHHNTARRSHAHIPADNHRKLHNTQHYQNKHNKPDKVGNSRRTTQAYKRQNERGGGGTQGWI